MKSSLVVSSILLSSSTAIAWPSAGNYWGDDNDHGSRDPSAPAAPTDNRQAPGQDPIDSTNAQTSMQGDMSNGVMEVIYDGKTPANYFRLCDVVAKVKLDSDYDPGSILMTEKAYIMGKQIRPSRDFDLLVKYFIEDSPGFHFVRDSQMVDATCLRWQKPGQSEPDLSKPEQRPLAAPHQVCDAETDRNGCGNTCQANSRNASQCASTQTRWPSAGGYWR